MRLYDHRPSGTVPRARQLDGDTHADAEAHDDGRTAVIEREGFRVIRYENTDVMRNLDGVIADVATTLEGKGSAA